MCGHFALIPSWTALIALPWSWRNLRQWLLLNRSSHPFENFSFIFSPSGRWLLVSVRSLSAWFLLSSPLRVMLLLFFPQIHWAVLLQDAVRRKCDNVWKLQWYPQNFAGVFQHSSVYNWLSTDLEHAQGVRMLLTSLLLQPELPCRRFP